MGWMKVLLSLLIMSLIVFVYTKQDGMQAERVIQPIETILGLVHSEELDVEEWQVLARDVQGTIESSKSFHQHVHNLGLQLEGWNQTYLDTSATEWTAEYQLQPANGVQESLRIMAYPENDSHTLTYTYKLTGNEASDWRRYELADKLQNRMLLFTMDTASLYTQVKSTSDAPILKSDSLLEKAHSYMKTLDAEEVEFITEETFVSVSAYTTVWKDQMITAGKPMNVQIALRADSALGTGTTVTIGTPIITTEY
ncbi:YwmB family TATA-box binding protein [Alkalicoccobacillus porphyridii]|uniref:YwmB family TATA-box binding protein n=1 Tax=Alkalicoccobacillus porphyridii TaxID=2597270 RepID=A0A553ZTF0_9BACI|nr:YwmB family TATA-box binding protein [Alkalicoccobacillus porphyridii]TSB44740.1 hypothetical protein FN960_19700 [Alkalicoccobacillus porphyridii]